MKRVLSLLAVCMLVITVAQANNNDLFSYDKGQVNTELAQLQELEDYVVSNTGVTFNILQETNNPLAQSVNLINGNNISGFGHMLSEPPLGVPSFLWGCVFGVIGVAVVYFVADDSEETKKAFKGCVVGTLVGVAIQIVVYAGTAATY